MTDLDEEKVVPPLTVAMTVTGVAPADSLALDGLTESDIPVEVASSSVMVVDSSGASTSVGVAGTGVGVIVGVNSAGVGIDVGVTYSVVATDVDVASATAGTGVIGIVTTSVID